MGLFGKKRARELAEPKTLPVGPWLREAVGRYPNLRPQYLIAGALQRVRYDQLLSSASTYIGGQDSYGLAEMIAQMVPSDLSVRQHGKHVIFWLGNYGLVDRQYRMATDWALSVTPDEGLTEVSVQLIEGSMEGVDLANEKTYRRTLEAIAHTMQQGVRIECRALPEAGGAAKAFTTVPFTPIMNVDLSVSSSFRFGDVAVGNAVQQLLDEELIGPRLRSQFEAAGGWPILVRNEQEYELANSSPVAMRWFAHALLGLGYEHTGDDRSAAIDVLLPFQEAVETRLTKPGEGQSMPQLSSSSRILPFAVSFGTNTPASGLASQLSAAATPRGWHWRTSRLPTRRLIDIVARPARVKRGGPETLGYGLHKASSGAVCGGFVNAGQEVQPPEWETVWIDGPEGSEHKATVVITGLTHQKDDGIRGSEALLQLMDAISDYAAGHPGVQDTEPTMLVIDRSSSWSS